MKNFTHLIILFACLYCSQVLAQVQDYPFLTTPKITYRDTPEPVTGSGMDITIKRGLNGPTDTLAVNQVSCGFPFPKLTRLNPRWNEIHVSPRTSSGMIARNGLNVRDLLAILRHSLKVQRFSKDKAIGGFQRLSADANGDGEINGADLLIIRKLILTLESSFSKVRPWRYVLLSDVKDRPKGYKGKDVFPERPWNYTVYANGNISDSRAKNTGNYSQILGNQDAYFNLAATKVGDVHSSNKYLCNITRASEAPNVTTRSTGHSGFLPKGSTVEVDIKLNNAEGMVAYEFPLDVNTDYLKLSHIQFGNNDAPHYHLNKKLGTFTILDINESLEELSIPEAGGVIKAVFTTTQDMETADAHIGWSGDYSVEVLDVRNTGIGSADVELVQHFKPVSDVRTVGNLGTLVIDSSTDQMVDVRVYDVQGRSIHAETMHLYQGRQEVRLDFDATGIFFVEVTMEDTKKTIKLVK